MKRLSQAISLAAFVAVAAGCSSPVKIADNAGAPVESRTPVPGGAGSSGATQPAAQSQVTPISVDPSAMSGAARVVYFDYDSFAVKDEFRPMIEGQAKRMNGNRSQRGTVEGHTDDRGGREYNLALGQKRAESVVRAMTLLGVPDTQLEAVSFGKERPAVQGSDEAAWAKNRRAELKDR